MRKVSPEDAAETMKSCHRCGHSEVILYYSDKVEGYFVGECPQCGAYSQIMRADVFNNYRHRKPRKTGDPDEPWIGLLSPKGEIGFKDKKTTLIERIYSKIRKKR